MLFQTDPDRITRLTEKFKSEISDKPTLVYCFRNKLEFGCTYPCEIEEILNKADIGQPPWWVDLLD